MSTSVGLGFVVIGLIFSICAWMKLYHTYGIKRNGIEVYAKVVRAREITNFGRGGYMGQELVLRYEIDGKSVAEPYTNRRHDTKYKLNDKIKIKYDRKKPRRFVNLSVSDTGNEIRFLLIGVCMVIIGVAYYFGWFPFWN